MEAKWILILSSILISDAAAQSLIFGNSWNGNFPACRNKQNFKKIRKSVDRTKELKPDSHPTLEKDVSAELSGKSQSNLLPIVLGKLLQLRNENPGSTHLNPNENLPLLAVFHGVENSGEDETLETNPFFTDKLNQNHNKKIKCEHCSSLEDFPPKNSLLEQIDKFEPAVTPAYMEHGTRQDSAVTSADECARMWRRFEWQRQWKRKSHCVSLYMWSATQRLLCCHLMGQSAEFSSSQLAPRVQLRHSASVKISLNSDVVKELHLQNVSRVDFGMKNPSILSLKKFSATSSRLSNIPDADIVEVSNSSALWMSDARNFKQLIFVDSSLVGLRFLELGENRNWPEKKFILQNVKIRFLKEVFLNSPVTLVNVFVADVMDFRVSGLHATNIMINEVHNHGITVTTGQVLFSNVTIEQAGKESLVFKGEGPVYLRNFNITRCIEPCIVYDSQSIEIVDSYVNGKLLHHESSAVKLTSKAATDLPLVSLMSFSKFNADPNFGSKFFLKDDHLNVCHGRGSRETCRAQTIAKMAELHPHGTGYEDLSVMNRRDLNIVAFCNKRVLLSNFTGSVKQFSHYQPEEFGQQMELDKSNLSTLDVNCHVDLRMTETELGKLILGHLRYLNATRSYVHDLLFVYKEFNTKGFGVFLREVVVDKLNYLELNAPALIEDARIGQVRQLVLNHGHADLPTAVISTSLDSVAENGVHIKSGVLLLRNVTLRLQAPTTIIRIEETGSLLVQGMPNFKDQCARREFLIRAVYPAQVVDLDGPADVRLQNCLILGSVTSSGELANHRFHCSAGGQDDLRCSLFATQAPLTLSAKTEFSRKMSSLKVTRPKSLRLDDLCVPQLTVASCEHCDTTENPKPCRVNLATHHSLWLNLNSNFWNLTISYSTVRTLKPRSPFEKYVNLELYLNKVNVSHTTIENLSNLVISGTGYFESCDLLLVMSRGITVLENSALYIKNSTLESLRPNSILVYGTLVMEEVDITKAEPGSIVLHEGSSAKFDGVEFPKETQNDPVRSEQLVLSKPTITIGRQPITFMEGYKLFQRDCLVDSRLIDSFGNTLVCERRKVPGSRKVKRFAQLLEDGPPKDGSNVYPPNGLQSSKHGVQPKKKFSYGMLFFVFITVLMLAVVLTGKKSFRKKLASIFSKSKSKETTSGVERSSSFQGWRAREPVQVPEEYAQVWDAIVPSYASPDASAASAFPGQVMPQQAQSLYDNLAPSFAELPSLPENSAMSSGYSFGAIPKSRTNSGRKTFEDHSISPPSFPGQVIPQQEQSLYDNLAPSSVELPSLPENSARSSGYSSGAIPKRRTNSGRRMFEDHSISPPSTSQQLSPGNIQTPLYDPRYSWGKDYVPPQKTQRSTTSIVTDVDDLEYPRFLPRQDPRERHHSDCQPYASTYLFQDAPADNFEESEMEEPRPFKRTRTYPLPYWNDPASQSISSLSPEKVGRQPDFSPIRTYLPLPIGHPVHGNSPPGQSVSPRYTKELPNYGHQQSHESPKLLQRRSTEELLSPVGIGIGQSWKSVTSQKSPTSMDSLFPKTQESPSHGSQPLISPGASPYRNSPSYRSINVPNYRSGAFNSPLSSPSRSFQGGSTPGLAQSPHKIRNVACSNTPLLSDTEEKYPHFARITREGAVEATLRAERQKFTPRHGGTRDEQGMFESIAELAKGLKNRLTLRRKHSTHRKTTDGSKELSSPVTHVTMMEQLSKQTGPALLASPSGSCFASSSPARQSSQRSSETTSPQFGEQPGGTFTVEQLISNLCSEQAQSSPIRQISPSELAPPNLYQHLMSSPPSPGRLQAMRSPSSRRSPPVLPSSQNYPPPPLREPPLPPVFEDARELQENSNTNTASSSSPHIYEEVSDF